MKFTGEAENNNLPFFAELVEYVPNSGKTRTIIKHTNGNRVVLSIAAGSGEEKSATAIYIQVITGNPELTINSTVLVLKPGDGTIIPLNSAYSFNPSLHFKMIMSVIQSAEKNGENNISLPANV